LYISDYHVVNFHLSTFTGSDLDMLFPSQLTSYIHFKFDNQTMDIIIVDNCQWDQLGIGFLMSYTSNLASLNALIYPINF
jgi:hypothetical protein